MRPLYVSGLIGPGDRKSVQPMAARLAPGDYEQLHHFIADGVWDAAPLESELLVQADRLVGGKDAVIWPVATRGRPRKRHIPDILSRAAEDMLANAKWQNVSWRNGTKGRLKARVRTADGPPRRIKDMGQQHLPKDEA